MGAFFPDRIDDVVNVITFRIGLKVFWAPEFSSKCNDFLFLGLSKEWWKEQSDYFELPINDQLDRVRNAGGFIIHAHTYKHVR